jgi:hypothetical protein
MAERATNTYSKLKDTLRSLGFESDKQDGCVIFTHSSGRPMIFLPAYKAGQTVRPIHLMMVEKQLTDSGVLKPGEFEHRMQHRPTAQSKR